jgi:hypothetical protein
MAKFRKDYRRSLRVQRLHKVVLASVRVQSYLIRANN